MEGGSFCSIPYSERKEVEVFSSSCKGLDDFVESQKYLLALERQEELDVEDELLTTKSPKQLQLQGLCLTKMQVADVKTGLYGRALVSLTCSKPDKPLPANSFGVRDMVELQPAGGGDGQHNSSSSNSQLKKQLQRKPRDSRIKGVVYRMTDYSITVAFDEFPDEMHSRGNVNLFKVSNDLVYKRYAEALKTARGESRSAVAKITKGIATRGNRDLVCQPVLDVLFKGEPATVASERVAWQPSAMVTLNPPQVDAIDLALAAKEVCMIHGPPGTGKTTTVVEFIAQCAARGEKVLACAPSNIAVDNMTERLAAYGKQVKVVRVGNPARLLPSVLDACLDSKIGHTNSADVSRAIRKDMTDVQKQLLGVKTRDERVALRNSLKCMRKDLFGFERKAVKEVVDAADVVLTTCIGAGSKTVQAYQFDTVVIDEACQAMEVACLIPLLLGKKLVLAGDHKQLPPTVKSQAAASKGLEKTLFDRLLHLKKEAGGRQHTATGPGSDDGKIKSSGPSMTTVPYALLSVQYRMHATIMEWSSQEMYGGKLTAFEAVQSHLLRDLAGVKQTGETIAPMVCIDTAGCGMEEDETGENESRSNAREVDLVAQYVRQLVEEGGLKAKEHIGVITPYSAQVKLLRERLLPLFPGMEIGTVDGFQGREKEAIVLSLVRSNARREVGFLAEERRLNVAVTRAKRHVCLVLDSQTVTTNKFIARLVDYCSEHADYRSAEELRPGGEGLAGETVSLSTVLSRLAVAAANDSSSPNASSGDHAAEATEGGRECGQRGTGGGRNEAETKEAGAGSVPGSDPGSDPSRNPPPPPVLSREAAQASKDEADALKVEEKMQKIIQRIETARRTGMGVKKNKNKNNDSPDGGDEPVGGFRLELKYLNSLLRLRTHEYCEQQGYAHESVGTEKERALVVSGHREAGPATEAAGGNVVVSVTEVERMVEEGGATSSSSSSSLSFTSLGAVTRDANAESPSVRVTVKHGKIVYADVSVSPQKGLKPLQQHLALLSHVPVGGMKLLVKGKVLRTDADVLGGIVRGTTLFLMGDAQAGGAANVAGVSKLFAAMAAKSSALAAPASVASTWSSSSSSSSSFSSGVDEEANLPLADSLVAVSSSTIAMSNRFQDLEAGEEDGEQEGNDKDEEEEVDMGDGERKVGVRHPNNKKNKKKNKQNHKKGKGRGGPYDDDDSDCKESSDSDSEDAALDRLVAEARVGMCHTPKCTTAVHLSGTLCQFCRWVFCPQHLAPVAHGCEKDYRLHQRKALQARLTAGSDQSPLQSRVLNEHEKSQLLTRLRNNLAGTGPGRGRAAGGIHTLGSVQGQGPGGSRWPGTGNGLRQVAEKTKAEKEKEAAGKKQMGYYFSGGSESKKEADDKLKKKNRKK